MALLAKKLFLYNIVVQSKNSLIQSSRCFTTLRMKRKSFSDIPGPKGLPFIGNSWRFSPIIGQYKISDLDKIMKELFDTYGRIVKVEGLIGHADLLFIFDGDEIQKIYKQEELLPHRPSMPSLTYYKGHLRKSFFGDAGGLIGVHGKDWETFRSKVQQTLLQPQMAKKYIEPLNEIADEFMDRIYEMRDENDELPANFLQELYKWALESVGKIALDTRLGCLSKHETSEAKQIIHEINTFFTTIFELELKMPIWKFYSTKAYKSYVSALDNFTEVCMKYINRTMKELENCNFEKHESKISIVERIVKKTKNPKIAAILALDLFLVGVDTTSVAVSSTIYQLSKNPEKQEKLFNELKTIFPTQNTKIDQQALESVPYLRACIKETLRMFPVVIANGRNLQMDSVIAGFDVPKGTHVIFPHLVVSNDTKYFSDPNKFIPERWIKVSETKQICPHTGQKIHPFVSLPFGFGRRMCIGRRYAEMELNIILMKIFRKYKVEYNYGELEYKINSTYIPASPLKFKLTARAD